MTRNGSIGIWGQQQIARALTYCNACDAYTDHDLKTCPKHITITISREVAEGWLSNDDYPHGVAWEAVDDAIRAALEGER